MPDKYNPQEWLQATLAESYAGTEDVTSPPALALLKQSQILPLTSSSTETKIKVFDNGCGMGQFTEVLLANGGEGVEVVAGDIEDSLIGAVRDKKNERGWGNVKVDKIDTMVSYLFQSAWELKLIWM